MMIGLIPPSRFQLFGATSRCLFHTATLLKVEESGSKLTKEQLKKREVRRAARRKVEAKKPAHTHPLYLPIPLALRYLRAVEVGYPASQQVITATTSVVADRGNPPLAGNVSLPSPLKDVLVAVFSNDDQQLSMAKKKFRCHLVGGSDTISKIKQGEILVDFDKAFATPDIAQELTSQVARILGPRQVLPMAKRGTVAPDLEPILKNSFGSIPFRQKGNSISLAVAKCDFSDRQVLENLLSVQTAFKEAVSNQKAKRPSILGRTTLTTTHGPGIVIDLV
ncbi:mitochondrial 54S ribosomal protein mrpl1 [Zygosaccharomyces mellis]|uniref:Mitochondrial 54S ribosomal protein mrpl1 n=1 Tax=Zygosaccharomyces mellis TaxID=42258 RepID=A0A4C2E6V8_9SACH|nr:mitochondrial 54S ribosomal protein mrpl1 [Zygosaccharomyces mellis]